VHLPVYEAVISEMKSQVDKENKKELLIGLNSLSPLNDFEKFTVRNINTFVEQYSSDFNLDGIFGHQNLEHELKGWCRLMVGDDGPFKDKRKKLETIAGILKFMVKRNHKLLYPEVIKLYQLHWRSGCHCQTNFLQQSRLFHSKRYDFIQSPIDLNIIIKFNLSLLIY
jgi:hypothetical protein